jgi:Na+-translocating ferredoxin:NAD+ oxidoreductase RnfG subunit
MLIEYYQEENDATEANKGGATGGLNKKKKKKKKTKADEHILDESFDYDKDVADMKKTSVKKKKKDYEGCECEYSFYVFHKNTKFRKYLYKMVSHFGFEGVILVLIILSSIKLVVDTYMFDLKEDDPIVKVS